MTRHGKWRVSIDAWRTALARLCLAVVLLLAPTFATAQTSVAGSAAFDHAQTGFRLDGQHVRQRCESCHVGGVLKGTPRDCAGCHVSGNVFSRANVTRPPTHFVTAQACESCHDTTRFSGARFNHVGVAAGTCATCHNGVSATTKGSGHMVTAASCDTCHRTRAWLPAASFDHSGVQPGTCATCHNGTRAKGRSANHTPYAQVSTIGNASCDACHKGFVAFVPAQVHANFALTSQCSTCHTGGFPPAVGRPNTPVHANAVACESCHRTSGWQTTNVDHATFTSSTNCASCHNGTSASGKPATHMPVGSTNCVACHNKAPGSWKPSLWNHTQTAVTGQCSTCHTGGFPPADGKPTNHVPYTSISAASSANCDACHKAGFSTWAPGTFHGNVSVSSQCSTCHTGTYLGAVGKPATPVHAGATSCEQCHNTARWTGAKVDHTPFTAATSCASCHNGSAASGKPGSHIPVGSTNCIACHAKSPASWKPATSWNHTQVPVAGQCATCHTGAFPPADGKVANHVPYTSIAAAASANCDRCHKAGYASWSPGAFHANVSVTNQCATCHTGTYLGATGKPATPVHATATACESCHNTASWTGARTDHTRFTAATNCASCHNGTTASGKTATHVPVGAANCIACHNKAPASWKPSLWNHTQVPVTNQCASCHSGAYPPADGKVANHIPYTSIAVSSAANCDGCHKAGYAAWAPGYFHRNYTTAGQCATCHTGNYLSAVGKPATAIHAGQTTCENCHKSTSAWQSATVDHAAYTAATNCASCHNGSAASGKHATHIPTTGNCIACHNKAPASWKPSLWNHTQQAVTGQCASCHTGSFQPADGKPTNHIPYAAVPTAAGANCDGCHKSGTTSWMPGYFHRNYSTSTGCAACHTGTYLAARGKPATPTHATVTVCESCHKSTTDWSNVTFAHSPANAVGTGTCDNCHNGSTAKGKPPTHIPVTTGPTKCDSCHKSQTSFATTTTMNHTVVAATTCKTCHGGSYASSGAQAKPANHIPEATQLLNGAGMDCNTCHTSTSSWGSTRMNHNNSMGNGAGWCKGCHVSGTSYLGSMERKGLNHRNKTPAPTDCSQSGCHRPLGSEGSAYTKWD